MQTDNLPSRKARRPFFRRSWVQVISWLLLAVLTSGGVLVVEICFNLFDWHPESIMESGAGGILALDVIALIGVFWACRKLARVTKSRRIQTYALVLFALGAITWGCFLSAEKVTATASSGGGMMNFSNFLARKASSPVWFRMGRVLLALLPAGLLLAAVRRKSDEQIEPVTKLTSAENEGQKIGEDQIAAKLARIENLLRNGHIDQRERDEARRQILLSV